MELDSLPDELLIDIFKFLPLKSVIYCMDVCIRWNRLCRSWAVWNNLIIVYNWNVSKSAENKDKICNLDLVRDHYDCIRHLKMHYGDDYDILIQSLKKCSNLIKLELMMCRLDSKFVEDVKTWPHLSKLHLQNSLMRKNCEKNILFDFDFHTNLISLFLTDFGLTNENFHTLLSCSKLCHICIEKIKDISYENILCLIINKMSILKTFRIYGGDSVNDHTLSMISRCLKLEHLAIIRCEILSDQGLQELTNLRKLRSLALWNNTKFTEAVLSMVLTHRNFHRLQNLCFSRVKNITPSIVHNISKVCNKLSFVGFYQCPQICNCPFETELQALFPHAKVVT